jgi:Skp family chaperone for outer membrane proteins
LLLRLRQLTCHPYLLRRDPSDTNTHPEDLRVDDEDLQADITAPRGDDLSESVRAGTLLGQEWVDKVRNLFSERQARLDKAEKDGDTEAAELEACSICMDGMENEMVTSCCHSFCAGCITEIFNAASRDNDLTDEQTQKGCRKCPLCRGIINRGEVFRASAFQEKVENDEEDEEEEAEEDLEIEAAEAKKTRRRWAVSCPLVDP